MTVLEGVKAGDRLFIKAGNYDTGRIVVANRVTPTGRVITEVGEFDPGGWKRGERNHWSRTRARRATEDDIAGVYRHGLVGKISGFSRWEKLSAEDLKLVAGIIDKFNSEH